MSAAHGWPGASAASARIARLAPLALAGFLSCERTIDIVSLDASASTSASRWTGRPASSAARRSEDPVPVDSTERYCLCVAPRPCGDACDSTCCGDALDPAHERACFDCRLRVERDAACAANYRICLDDPLRGVRGLRRPLPLSAASRRAPR